MSCLLGPEARGISPKGDGEKRLDAIPPGGFAGLECRGIMLVFDEKAAGMVRPVGKGAKKKLDIKYFGS
jgi:hypothetical protein